MPVLSLKDAEKARDQITRRQRRMIKKLYADAAKEVADAIKSLEGRTNISSIMRTEYLKDLERQLTLANQKISKELRNIVTSGVKGVADATTTNALKNLSQLGFNVKGLLLRVPDDVVRSIVTGQVYDSGWSLSRRIWGIQEKTLQDIHTVVAKGIAENKSVYDIAKDIEKYVDPNAKKTWDWNKVYPGTNKKVDYNAQRLARTLTQHAFQQATKRTNDPNPFVTGYEWHSALIHGRTCSICKERHGTIYKKDEVPMDHPNGLCTILPVVGNLSDVANQIADWTEAEPGTFPEIDQFWNYLNRN